ncbi:MAG: prepilin-type N-terminal cleavage/methylation domain-containing protein, partial [Coraliomargarita sp.]
MRKHTQIRTTATRSGMTLIEVVLAIAVAGFVLASATTFLISVSNIWHERQNRH